MDLNEFISINDVDKGCNLVDIKTLEEAEKIIGTNFGEQLRTYILKFGYLGYKHIELHGMNSNQNLSSDIVKQTLYIHKYFDKTKGLIVIENQGEGNYIVTNKYDKMFEFDSELNELINLDIDLFTYILQRFLDA